MRIRSQDLCSSTVQTFVGETEEKYAVGIRTWYLPNVWHALLL
jgi:hypothetical protein